MASPYETTHPPIAVRLDADLSAIVDAMVRRLRRARPGEVVTRSMAVRAILHLAGHDPTKLAGLMTEA